MQSFIDLKNGAVSGVSIPPAANTNANTNGAGVDLINGDVRTQAMVLLGTMLTNTVVSVTIEESSDNSNFAALTDTTNSNTGNLNTNNANSVFFLGFQRSKRYVRAKATIAGTNAGLQLGVVILEQKKHEGDNSGWSAT